MNQTLVAVLAVIGALAAFFLVVFASLATYDAVSSSGMMDDMGEMMEDMGGMMDGMDGMMGDRGPETAGSASGEGDVRIVDFSFQPTALTVTPGTIISWTNEDSAPHTATGDSFDTGRLDEGESTEVTFDNPGTFEYVCDFHRWMEGRVVVSTPSP